MGNFMVYQDRLEINLLQLFGHPENSEWFSIISVIIFEVKHCWWTETNKIGNDDFVFYVSIALNIFTAPLPLPLLRRPWICNFCQQTSPNHWFANVNMTSYRDVTNSAYLLTMTTMGLCHCSILEFGRGHPMKQSPRASLDLCTSLITRKYNLIVILKKCRNFFAQIFEILPKFLTNQKFWVYACTSSSYSTGAVKPRDC